MTSDVGDGLQLAPAVRAPALPLARRELLLRPGGDDDAAVLFADVLALTVDRHRGRDHEPAHRVATRDDPFQERCGRHGIHPDVPVDLVHRLTDADHGGEMHDAVDAAQRPVC